MTHESDRSAVLSKVSLILQVFDADTPVAGVNEVARRTGLAKTTVHRLVHDLTRVGLLEQSGSRFRLGDRLFELGTLVPTQRALRYAAAQHLEDLARLTGDTAVLGLTSRREVIFAEKYVGAGGRGRVITQVDGRVPLHCGASGKLFLAFGPPHLLEEVLAVGLVPRTPFSITEESVLRGEVEQIRTQGYSVDREELVRAYGAVAAPVMHGGVMVASLAVVSPVSRLSIQKVKGPLLRAAAAMARA